MLKNFLPSATDMVIAFRNVTRHRRRTLSALAIIVGGVVAFLMTGGFVRWMLENMAEGIIYSEFGHLQIVRPGYFDKGISDPYRFLLPEDAKMDPDIRTVPEVAVVSPRLAFTGLLGYNDATLTFSGAGVDPVDDLQVSKYVTILSGERLSREDPNGVALGEGLAQNLGVKVGDALVLMTNTAKGQLSASDVHVRGIFSTFNKEYDAGALRAPISLVRKLVKVKGATSWVVLVDKTPRTDETLAVMRARLAGRDYQVYSWFDLADYYRKTVDLFEQQVLVIEIMIGLIVAVSIGNTMQMVVIERTTEIGTMMAIGRRRSDVLRLFLLEGCVLGFLGGLIGAGGGWLLSIAVSKIGIPLPPPPGMSEGFDAEVLVDLPLAINGFVLALGTTMAASVFPAFKASRTNVVDALRRQA
ncbi:MAG TPA: ABC transporter permease [Nitrospira sp.]|nr:ABC transporter permease [Nitrospira sp.]